MRALLIVGSVCQRLFRFEQPEDQLDECAEEHYFDIAVAHGRDFLERFPQLSGRTIEIGCGYGGLLEAMREKGVDAVGLDIDPRRVAFAVGRGLHAIVADAERIPFPDESFDAVVSYATLEHIPDIQQAITEAHRVVRRGGHFFATWGPSWLSWNGPHLIKCLGVPWVQLWFSDRTILAALADQRRAGTWPGNYLDYKIADFQSMGRTTRAALRRAARAAGWELLNESAHSPRRWKDWLSRLPPFNEMIPGSLQVTLRRPR